MQHRQFNSKKLISLVNLIVHHDHLLPEFEGAILEKIMEFNMIDNSLLNLLGMTTRLEQYFSEKDKKVININKLEMIEFKHEVLNIGKNISLQVYTYVNTWFKCPSMFLRPPIYANFKKDSREKRIPILYFGHFPLDEPHSTLKYEFTQKTYAICYDKKRKSFFIFKFDANILKNLEQLQDGIVSFYFEEFTTVVEYIKKKFQKLEVLLKQYKEKNGSLLS